MKKLYETPKFDINYLSEEDVMLASDDADENLQIQGENAGRRFGSILNWQ